MSCNWCKPSGELTGKRCKDCQRIYEMHLAADNGDDTAATEWIWNSAAQLRSQRRDGLFERQQHELRIDGIPVIDTSGLGRHLQGGQ